MMSPKPTIFFRVDVYPGIGKGHFMRCLTLATQLKKSGCYIFFLCAAIDPASKSMLFDRGIRCLLLSRATDMSTVSFNAQQDAQRAIHQIKQINQTHCILIVDNYGIDYVWHELVMPHVYKLCVIDDLNNRNYHCHLLIDQSYGKTEAAYQGKVPDDCQLCIGSDYCLVSDAFLQLRSTSLEHRKLLQDEDFKIKNVLVTMGGSDINNATGIMLRALSQLQSASSLSITVVIGSLCPHIELVRAETEKYSFKQLSIIIDAQNMAELMTEADICLSAAGSTLWEACVLGLPTIVLVTADNQKWIAAELSRQGAIDCLGENSVVAVEDINQQLDKCFKDIQRLSQLSYRSRQICDGLGAERVCQTVLEGVNIL